MTEQQYAEIAKRRAPRKRGWLRRWLRRGLFGVIGLVLVTVSAGVTYDRIWSSRRADESHLLAKVHDPYAEYTIDYDWSVHPDEDGMPLLQWASLSRLDRTWEMYDVGLGLDRYVRAVYTDRSIADAEFRRRLEGRVAACSSEYDAIDRGLQKPRFSRLWRDDTLFLRELIDALQERRVLLWLDDRAAALADWLASYRIVDVCDPSIDWRFESDMYAHGRVTAELPHLLDGVDPRALPLDELESTLTAPNNLDYYSLRAHWDRTKKTDRDQVYGTNGILTPLHDDLQRFLFVDRTYASIYRCYRLGIEALNADDPRPGFEAVYDQFDNDIPRARCQCHGYFAPYLYASFMDLAAATAYVHVAQLAVGQLQNWCLAGRFDSSLPPETLTDDCHTAITYESSEHGFVFTWEAPYWPSTASEPTPQTKRWSYTLPETVED